jgi:serine/threonine protein phosphatase 1
MKTFAVGDIHGAYKSLVQCLGRSKFDYNNDHLIVMGDVVDGYPDVRQCFDELLKIKHCDLVIGNHDVWALNWALRGDKPEIWITQGGIQTMASYNGGPMPQAHVDFLRNAQLWFELGDQLFVHGGFNPDAKLQKQTAEFLTWDRSLLTMAWRRHHANPDHRFGSYRDIFIGHTTTETYKTLEPIHVCNVWNIDTGAGWAGKLTIIDVETKEYWQSDLSSELYGGTPNRL